MGPSEFAQTTEFMDAVSECRPLVRALVARILRRRIEDPDVEDCTQEALRRALEGWHRLQEQHGIQPWVLGIARHVALDALRARHRSLSRHHSPSRHGNPGGRVADDAHHSADAVEHLVDDRSGPETLAVHSQRAMRLRAALAELPEYQRDALLLFHAEGLGYREIAARLAVPVGTVGTWVLRARQAIAVVLEDGASESAATGSGLHKRRGES